MTDLHESEIAAGRGIWIIIALKPDHTMNKSFRNTMHFGVLRKYAAGATLKGLAREHDLSRNLIRVWLAKYDAGSMGRRGNPYDNAKAESSMKTLKVEAVYPMAYETVEDVMADLPRGAR